MAFNTIQYIGSDIPDSRKELFELRAALIKELHNIQLLVKFSSTKLNIEKEMEIHELILKLGNINIKMHDELQRQVVATWVAKEQNG